MPLHKFMLMRLLPLLVIFAMFSCDTSEDPIPVASSTKTYKQPLNRKARLIYTGVKSGSEFNTFNTITDWNKKNLKTFKFTKGDTLIIDYLIGDAEFRDMYIQRFEYGQKGRIEFRLYADSTVYY